MTKRTLAGAVLFLSCFSTGCSMEFASELDKSNKRLEEVITNLKLKKEEISRIPAEIAKLRSAVAEMEKKMEMFLSENPKVMEFHQREIEQTR